MRNILKSITTERGYKALRDSSHYSKLATINGYTDRAIYEFQLQKLQSKLEIQDNMSDIKSLYDSAIPDIDKLNKFYNSEANNIILEKIVDILNAPFKQGKFRETSFKKNGQFSHTYTNYEKVWRAIDDLTNELNKNRSKYGYALAALDKITPLLRMRSKNKISIFDYIAEKANLLEEITAQALQESQVYQDCVSIVTGSLERQKKGQIIQDVITIRKDQLNTAFENGPLQISIKGEEPQFINNLGELLDKMQNHNSTSHIVLSEPLYNELAKASALSVQVKSGIKQKIINANKQRQVTLGNLNSKSNDSVSTAFNLINELIFSEKDSWTLRKKKIDNNNPELQSLANYSLGKDISNLLHFGPEKVHVLMTETGFETPYKWMKRNKMMLKFDSWVQLKPSLMTESRFYNLRGFGAKN